MDSEGFESGVLAAAASIVVYGVLYYGSRILTPRCTSVYGKLSVLDKRDWDVRGISNLHALLCVIFAYRMVYKSTFFWEEGKVPVAIRTCPGTFVALGISFGYFLCDFITCLKYKMGGLGMTIHHIGSLLSVTTALVTGNGHMHTLWMLFTEFTTPFINNRWFFDKLGLKASPLALLNSLAIVVFWVFARLAVFPPFFLSVWRIRDQLHLITHLSKVLIVAVPVVLACLNLYWYYRIMLGAYKIFFGKKRVKSEEAKSS